MVMGIFTSVDYIRDPSRLVPIPRSPLGGESNRSFRETNAVCMRQRLFLQSYVHRSQRQDLGPFFIPQFGPNHTGQSGSDGITVLVDEHTCVVVEFDQTSVRPPLFFFSSHHHSMSDVASPDLVGNPQARPTWIVGAEASLFLHYHNDSVTCSRRISIIHVRPSLCLGQYIPIFAALDFFLITATHSTMAAPELSMQLSIVCSTVEVSIQSVDAYERGQASHFKLYHRGSMLWPRLTGGSVVALALF